MAEIHTDFSGTDVCDFLTLGVVAQWFQSPFGAILVDDIHHFGNGVAGAGVDGGCFLVIFLRCCKNKIYRAFLDTVGAAQNNALGDAVGLNIFRS